MAFRILVTGSRDFDDMDAIARAMLPEIYAADVQKPTDVVVVHGDAKGADRQAAFFADCNGWTVEPYPADWSGPCDETCDHGPRRPRRGGGTYCPAAGNRRNALMVSKGADVCLAFPLRGSRGTWDCVKQAKEAGIRVEVTKP